MVDEEKESLKYIIACINDQKGSFRNVTEECLEQELREANTGQTETQEEREENGADAKDLEDPKSRKEEVYQVREEILKQVTFVLATFSPKCGHWC